MIKINFGSRDPLRRRRHHLHIIFLAVLNVQEFPIRDHFMSSCVPRTPLDLGVTSDSARDPETLRLGSLCPSHFCLTVSMSRSMSKKDRPTPV
ncbi:hypothetical protein RRG08_025593 [Elysia crispata]|uniref:Uncharacterized protein n=1 Tax=Elysia crispata TaxID=231223 RepID=A0AAE0YE30_9GAST|nr:hypothetical protein RRG08_025593 [Elysia crispata]